MKLWKLFKNQKCLSSVGVLLIIVGVIFITSSATLFNSLIDGELVLTPEKHTYDVWKKTPMPITLDFYFFNWLNPEDVRNTSTKPRLEQKGPYVFREVKEKVDIVWNPNGTVSFKMLRFWYFDEEKSNGSLSDEITTLNVVAVTAAAKSKDLGYVMKKGLSFSMKTFAKDVYTTKTVGELLFDGYQDKLIDVALSMPKIEGIDLPPFDKFGWFYLRNGTTAFDGLTTMGTGTGEIPLGRVDRWNFRHETGFFEGECGKIYGSSGEFWPPNVPKDEIHMFSADMCRTIGFQYDKEVSVKGIKGYRFIGGEKTLDNGTNYPENECFCGGECVPSGVLNLTACRFGAPGFLSFPHFYIADPYYVDQVEGLSPNKEEHELSITLEPRTGIPLAVSAKFQINILMTPNEAIGIFSDVPRIFFPIMWFKQEVVIPDDLASGLKHLINLPSSACIFGIVSVVLGGLMLVILAGTHFFRKSKTSRLNRKMKTAHFSKGKEGEPLNGNDKKCDGVVTIKADNEKLSLNNGFVDT